MPRVRPLAPKSDGLQRWSDGLPSKQRARLHCINLRRAPLRFPPHGTPKPRRVGIIYSKNGLPWVNSQVLCWFAGSIYLFHAAKTSEPKGLTYSEPSKGCSPALSPRFFCDREQRSEANRRVKPGHEDLHDKVSEGMKAQLLAQRRS